MKYNTRIVNELRRVLGNLQQNRDVLKAWDPSFASYLDGMKTTAVARQYVSFPGHVYTTTIMDAPSKEVVHLAQMFIARANDRTIEHAYNRAFEYTSAFTEGCSTGAVMVVQRLLARVAKKPKYHRSMKA